MRSDEDFRRLRGACDIMAKLRCAGPKVASERVAVVVKTDGPMGSRFGIGEFTTHLRTYFSGDWLMFTRGYDLAFDPWPCVCVCVCRGVFLG